LISKTQRYHHRFTLYDRTAEVEFTDLLEIHPLELPKLPEIADAHLLHWRRFLRAKSKEELKMVAKASPAMVNACWRISAAFPSFHLTRTSVCTRNTAKT
jgi:hypothetical protein